MLSIVKTMSLHGLDGYLVHVQVDISNGLPCWEIVGLPDISVKEAKERVKIAIKNSGFDFPSKRIVVNLAPANTKKEGSIFDLPIAIGILIATEMISCKNIDEYVFIGELSLDGKIRCANGVLPICIEAQKAGIKNIILSSDNAKEASIVKGINVIPVNNLVQVIKHLNQEELISPIQINQIQLWKETSKNIVDFSEVKGQENVKRALEIAAAGGHNCIMIGSPGSGKTMLARRLPTILPELSFEEALEITKIHSIAGKVNAGEGLITTRPFRDPHHTISGTSLVGGGRIPKPGEISLAHYGVLFLDELPEFQKSTLELLRGPLEDRKISISRVNASLEYPCNFMLIASLNPCPCGFFGSEEKECVCTPQSISKYIGKISGPLLDRIDINISVNAVKYSKLEDNSKSETSEQIRRRVNYARNIQITRYKGYEIYSNSELTPKLIEKFCILEDSAKHILKNSFEKMGFSARAYSRILKVSRTIADLEEKDIIESKHIAEAIQYRNLDKKYWKN